MKSVSISTSDTTMLTPANDSVSRSKLNFRISVICVVILLFLLSFTEIIVIIILHLQHQEVLCLTSDYEQGICTVPDLCPSRSKDGQPGNKINMCGSINKTQTICCPIWTSLSRPDLIESPAITPTNIVSSTHPVASTHHNIVSSTKPVASTYHNIVSSSSPVASTHHNIVSSSSPVPTTRRNTVGSSVGKPLPTNFINSSFVVQPTPPKSNIVLHAERIAKQKCEEYGKTVILEIPSPILIGDASGVHKVDTCSMIATPLIANGEEASPKEFPHMVLIGYGESLVSWQCGGSLISERFVLSAAHCASSKMGLATWAKVGDLDTSTNSDDALPETFRIVERIVHPKYQKKLAYNDIALFKLEGDVEISAYVRPLCLFTNMELPQNEFTATGWGHLSGGFNFNTERNATENGTESTVSPRPKPYWANLLDLRIISNHSIQIEHGPASSKLMKTKLNLVSSKTCSTKYEPSKLIPQGILAKSQICAGDGYNDTCKGDSGGPLQISLKEPYCMYGIVGITSFGKICSSGYPGVYTRVSFFLPWIVKTVWPELLLK